MLGTEMKNANGSNRGVKQIHKETNRRWASRGSTTPYRPPGGKLSGSIRINHQMLAPDRIPEQPPTDVPEPTPTDVPEAAPTDVPEQSPETADSAR